MAVVVFPGDFVTLALVTGFYMHFNLWAKAFPGEGLVNGVDGLGNARVAKARVVRIYDVSLEI